MHDEQRIAVWLKVVCVVIGLLLVAPTLIIIPLSFTGEEGFRFPPRTWSLQYYQQFFTDPAWMGALGASLEIGIVVAVIATVLGTAAAIGLARTRSTLVGPLNGIFLAPIVIPSVIVAVAIYAVFLRTGLVGNVAGFVIAHTAIALPFVVTAVSSSLVNLDRGLERAAATLGAPPWRTLVRVTLPQLVPGMASGALFAFVTSFDEVMISLYLSSSELVTLPVKMFASVTTDIDPTIAAASSVLVVVTTAVILLPLVLRKKSQHV